MTREEIKSTMKEVIQEELGPFFVAREEHFQHHQFIKSFISTADKIKGTACKTVTIGVITAAITLLVLGFKGWVREFLAAIGIAGKL